jgi:hypothetical protein
VVLAQTRKPPNQAIYYLPLQTNRHLWSVGGGACLSGRDVVEVWFGNLGRQMTQFRPPMSTQTWHLLQQSKKHADRTTYHVDLISTIRIMTRVQAAPETPRNSLSPSSFRETWEFIFHVSFSGPFRTSVGTLLFWD